MDIDPMEYVEGDDEGDGAAAREKSKSRLNAAVAVTIALLATFMGICKVKDDNIVQAMQQAQAAKIDQWNFYQARKIRADVYQATVDQLRLQKLAAPATAAAAYDREISHYQKQTAEQLEKQKEPKQLAEQADTDYDRLNTHDDQFDLSDAFLSIALSLFAVTALTQKRWLFALALIPTFFGVLMGLAGLLGWGIHPDALTRLLS